MAASEIAVGDIVHLKSGGPAMTVIRIADPEYVICAWFSDAGVYGDANFLASVLKAGHPGLIGKRL